jgi:AbrB family looped-hinge helix DNA binding protein
MLYTVSITKKGQMTIPKDVRDRLGVEVPGKVTIDVRRDGSLLLSKPLSLDDVRRLLAEPAGTEPLSSKERQVIAGMKADGSQELR